MSSKRNFGDLEFLVLWELITGEGLPRPFIFTSRTPLLYDYLREKHEVAEHLRSNWNWTFDSLARVVGQPDLRIVVTGFDGRDPRRAQGRIRMIAFRRGDLGYLIRQVPGETYVHSSGFEVRECDPLRLADGVVGALPEVEAGHQADMQLGSTRDGALDHAFERTVIADTFEDSMSHRSKKFLAEKPACMGTVEVIQGHSTFGPRGIIAHRLQWRDLEDDGRYIIRDQQPYTATGADSSRFTTAINIYVAAVVQAIKDERGTLHR
ncbi:ESX secretion-associated protein EspG [Nocardia sp. NPDC020380]|uniref:ESX secretion-associated protein EspG n=1 Tax=Nocardia sp. NPDC020380 TaxID=3364309 RepID=UPI0037B53970